MLKVLSAGRVVVVHTNSYQHSLAVILQQNVKKTSRTFTVLLLCEDGDELEEAAKSLIDFQQHKIVKPYQPMKGLFHPSGVIKHAVVEVDGRLLRCICDEVVKVEANRIIEDYKKRQIPRFQ